MVQLVIENALKKSEIINDFLLIDQKFTDCINSLQTQITNDQVNQQRVNYLVSQLLKIRAIFLEAAILVGDLEKLIDKIPLRTNGETPHKITIAKVQGNLLARRKFRTITSINRGIKKN
jgi:hypothetical protein